MNQTDEAMSITPYGQHPMRESHESYDRVPRRKSTRRYKFEPFTVPGVALNVDQAERWVDLNQQTFDTEEEASEALEDVLALLTDGGIDRDRISVFYAAVEVDDEHLTHIIYVDE